MAKRPASRQSLHALTLASLLLLPAYGHAANTLIGDGASISTTDGSSVDRVTVIGEDSSSVDSPNSTIVGAAQLAVQSSDVTMIGWASTVEGSIGAVAQGSNVIINYSDYAVQIGSFGNIYDSDRAVGLGLFTQITNAPDSVAIGSFSVAERPNIVSFGNDSLQRVLTNVAAGSTTYDAVNFGQLQALAADIDALEATLASSGFSGGTVTSSSIQNAAGQGVTVTDAGVSVDTDMSMEGNRITDVGDPVSGQDAVNLRTMQSALAPLEDRITTVEGRVGRLERHLDQVERKVSSGVAIAMAMAQPVMMSPSQVNAVTAGVASFNGQSAMSVTYNRMVDTRGRGQLMLSGGMGVSTGSKPSARVGVSFSW